MSSIHALNYLPSKRRVLGAVIGGVVAGLVIAVWILIGEVVSHQPSQLVQMVRQIGGWLGGSTPLDAPVVTTAEEYWGNFGHLALSALAGFGYALVWRRDRSILLNGLAFGAAFFIVAHAVVGPLIGLTPGMWNMPRSVFLTGCVINGFFGICTAFFAYHFEARTSLEDRHQSSK